MLVATGSTRARAEADAAATPPSTMAAGVACAPTAAQPNGRRAGRSRLGRYLNRAHRVTRCRRAPSWRLQDSRLTGACPSVSLRHSDAGTPPEDRQRQSTRTRRRRQPSLVHDHDRKSKHASGTVSALPEHAFKSCCAITYIDLLTEFVIHKPTPHF